MKRIHFLLLLPLLFLTACDKAPEQVNKIPTEVEAGYNINMHFAKPSWSENADTLFLLFRITDKKTNKKMPWFDLKKENFEIREDGGNPPNKDIILQKIIQKQGTQAGRISRDVEFWLMVDRGKTISEQDMEDMKSAIRKTVENLPDSSTYISFFDKNTSERKLITSSNFHEFEKDFTKIPEARGLYQSIMDSFEKFAKEPLSAHKDVTNTAKYLLIFTDGRINYNSPEEIENLNKSRNFFKKIDNEWENQIQIHAFRYGSESDGTVDRTLSEICLQRQNTELKGGFYPADNVADVVDSLRGFVDNLSADYELMLVNPSGKYYYGAKQYLQVIVNRGDKKAVGKIPYTIGSKEKSIITGGETEKNTLISIILGLFIIGIAFFIMQVVIPYIIFRVTNFEKKYVKPYYPTTTDEGEVYEACSYCQEPLEKGELIVVKCPHKIHWDCWIENGHKCVEYGQHCKTGIQYYFDKNHPFDLKQSPYYLKWAMSGIISGFLIWFVFHLTSKLSLFSNFIDTLLNKFYPQHLMAEIEGKLQILSNVESSFYERISGLLLAGILLGFVLTFLFSYINDFRQKKGKVLFSIFFRALIGAIVGFAVFLTGSIICISMGRYENVWWLDIIPWTLFGGTIALCLVYKTTIKWQDALIGGAISGIVSFFILYTTTYLPVFGVMFSFMLCSAGLGISIIARHHLAQKFFLKYKGERREGEIAIHKWMNDSGGSNEVTIGKSNHCTIQMNWDSSDKIPDKQVKLYIDPKRRVPMMKALENGMFYEGRDARKDDQLPLKNGVKFMIGNTEFQYIEK